MSLSREGHWAVEQQVHGVWSRCTIWCGYATEQEAWDTIPGGRESTEFKVVAR